MAERINFGETVDMGGGGEQGFPSGGGTHEMIGDTVPLSTSVEDSGPRGSGGGERIYFGETVQLDSTASVPAPIAGQTFTPQVRGK